MNNNKGFIGMGIILAIIAVLVVGGGAYYLGTKNNSVPQNTEVNLPVENQNSVVNNNIATNNKDNCKVGDIPWLKVLSPNGGENYILGQTINIRWDSKCIDSDKLVYLNIGIKDSQAVPELLSNKKVANSGSYNFTIPNNYNIGGYNSNKYEISIGYIYGNGDGVNDHSDAPFSINSVTISTTYTYTNHGFSIELPKGFIPHEEQSEGGPSLSISLPIGGIAYVTNAAFWEKYNIPNYTYIKDQKIGNTTFRIYTYSGNTLLYWFKQGNVGYEFSSNESNKIGLENLIKTFKFIGWPQN